MAISPARNNWRKQANSGLGIVAVKACEGARSSLRSTTANHCPGRFNLAIDFAVLVNPDEMAGSHIKQREV
ncbi:MAG TPA: hypothetical protein VKE30_11180 [Chthoniobacterales bacterium]|nr:hypothetical protein [Chthoniobacterales bacterium]